MNKKLIGLVLAGLYFFIPVTVHAVTITGSYTGTFVDPVPGSPPSVTTGIGTDSITWGEPCDGVTNCTASYGVTPSSGFTFTAVPFSTEIGEPFVLGEIEFYNGTIMAGTEISMVTLLLDGFQITPTQFAGGDSRVISIVNTPNSSDPIASADRAVIPFAYFPAGNEFGVLESKSASATLLGKFSEASEELFDLEILGFGEATSLNGFVAGKAPSAVPLPGTLYLLGSGLAGLIGFRRKRTKK